MEQQQRSLIFTAAVGLIILAIIIGSIYYLVKFIQGRVAGNSQVQTSQQPINSESPEGGSVQGAQLTPDNEIPTPQVGNANPGKKVYNGGSFQFAYPDKWGVLTCTNSQNIELDPANASDSKIACDLATKPITIVVGDIKGCQGDTSKIGSLDVVKSQGSEGEYLKYQWCTKTTPVLNITHRVSPNNERATSKVDYSSQIEDLIKNISFSAGS